MPKITIQVTIEKNDDDDEATPEALADDLKMFVECEWGCDAETEVILPPTHALIENEKGDRMVVPVPSLKKLKEVR